MEEIIKIIKCIPFKFVLPIVLLGLQFSLKMVIDRKATAFQFATGLLEIPINMFFISLALLSAFIITGTGAIVVAFVLFLVILVCLVFCILFWRRSVDHFENKYFFWAFGLGFLNLILALPTISYIIYFLINNTKA
jgi:hypothetical protein